MRIGMIGRYFNRQGGVSRALAELSDRAGREHEVDVFANEVLDRDGSPASFRHVPMLERPGFLQAPSFALALRRRLDVEAYDLVHCQDPQSLLADIYTAQSSFRGYIEMRRSEDGIGGRLSRVYPPHVVLSQLSGWCYEPERSLIIAVSASVKDELQQVHRVREERIRVIYNGVDIDTYKPAASKGEARRAVAAAAGDVDPEVPVLVFVGYEFQRKGLRTAILALSEVDDRETRLWVVGGADASEFKTLARAANVADRVRFLGHQSQVAPFLQAADAFVFPTRYEAASMAILEAMASGLPLITTDVAMAAELVTDGQEGYLIRDSLDHRELAEAIDRFLGHREGWPAMGEAARRLASDHSWDKVWSRTHGVYEDVARAKREGRAVWT